MSTIKLRGFDKTIDEVALLICFLVDHAVYVPKSVFKIYFNIRNFSRIYQEALIFETTHQIGTKVSGPCALNVKNISQKRKFQLVHFCKNYHERKRS
jgi:hypothetical protein